MEPDLFMVDCGDFQIEVDQSTKTVTVRGDQAMVEAMPRAQRRAFERRVSKALRKLSSVLDVTYEDGWSGVLGHPQKRTPATVDVGSGAMTTFERTKDDGTDCRT